MKPKHDAQREILKRDHQPYHVLGADKVTSFLWKDGDERTGWQYSFNVFRVDRTTGEVSQLFQPTDVESLARLTRLLAFELSSDGCLPSDLRNDLACLASCLDDVLRAPTSPTAERKSSDGTGTN